jgi:glycosyltransferase involved in cell wall biosynthesis
MKMPQEGHICVCICTYKRPEPLNRLLSKLDIQETEGLFDFSIVIVDNDRLESGRRTVESRARTAKIFTRYYVEPEQNIAMARNRAIENSNGDYVAFIDDDESPGAQWLVTLYKTIHHYGSDGVLGPVLPHFEEEPPQWVLKGKFFDRPTHPTGHVLEWKNTRTGNAVLKRDLFKVGTKWFDSSFGSGGEDRDFFRRKIEQGHIFVWCNEAPVFETVPPKRWKRTVLLKRALLRGKMALNTTEPRFMSLFNSAVAVAVYSCCLPVLLFLGHHVFMKYLIKDCDHLGKLLASLGIDWVGEKYVGG